jgi:hypothetical protein
MLHTIWYLFKNHTLKVEQHENNSDPIFNCNIRKPSFGARVYGTQ